MHLSKSALKVKSTAVESICNKDWATFWDTDFIPKWVPLLLGVILAELLAFLIVREIWYIAIPLVFLIPVVILFNRYPFVAITLWLLIAPIFQVTPTRPWRVIYWTIHRFMPPAVLGIIILAALLQPKKNNWMRLGRAELTMAVFMGIGPLSILLLQPADGVLPTLYQFFDAFCVPFCLYWIIRLTAPAERDLQRLLPVFLAVAVFQCTVGILTLFAPQVVHPAWRSMGDLEVGARITGTLRAPGPYTATLVLLCLTLYHAALQRKAGLIRAIFLFAFAFGCLMVFSSFERASWLGGLAATLGLLIMYPKATIRMILILSVLMALFGVSLLADQLAWASERLNNKENAQYRLVMYQAAVKMIKSRPFFGWGYRNFRRYNDQFRERVANYVSTVQGGGVHNTFLSLMSEMGLVGFFCYIFPLVWWLRLTIKVLPRMPAEGFWSRRLLIILWLAILDQIFVNSFMNMAIDTFSFGVCIWWVTLGLIGNIVCHYLEPGDIGLPDWVRRSFA